MYAESLVRAENQPQPTTTNHSNDSVMMMDLTRDGLFILIFVFLNFILFSID
jgi:hypothetical protein